MTWFALRRQLRARLQPPSTSNADPHFGCRSLLTELLAKSLVLGHLMIRDALAGHRDSSLLSFEESL
jgi:hypothetical protein